MSDARNLLRLAQAGLRRYAPRPARWFPLDRGGDHRDAVFLSSTQRSGSTWVADLISCDNEFRYIFEPFHPGELPQARVFGGERYMRPDDSDPVRLEYARRVLSGRLRSRWTDQLNRRIGARRRLVKEVQSNLFLKWLRVQFPEMPCVLLLRHPCAFVASTIKAGWDRGLDRWTRQEMLMEDYLEPYRDALAAAETRVEKAAHNWGLSHHVAFRQLEPGDAHVVFYEDIWSEPERVLPGLFQHIRKEYDATRVLRLIRRPSATVGRYSAVVKGTNPLESWKSVLSTADIDTVLGIVDSYGVGAIYGDRTMPDASAVEALLAEGQ